MRNSILEYNVDFFFFFKQKTAYEMRISDWSSDVCSSDLVYEHSVGTGFARQERVRKEATRNEEGRDDAPGDERRDVRQDHVREERSAALQIGSASCRERVCR